MGTLDELIAEHAPQPDEPDMDMASCAECQGSWPVSYLKMEQDGDYESGYYNYHLCPDCEDGGAIEDYYPSEESLAAWKKSKE